MDTKKFETNYYIASHWLHGNLILCNEIAELDQTIYDNFNGEIEEETEIYQWFLTSYSQDDAEWLAEHFGLIFTYSEKLDLMVLCVTHYGTSWDYVYWTTDIENAQAKLGDKKQL